MPRERRGTHAITRTHLRVNGPDALAWWAQHLHGHGVRTAEIAERDGRLTLDFEDPKGQRLALIDDGGVGAAFPWDHSPVPAAYQVRGLGPIRFSVPALLPTDVVLQQVLNMRLAREYPHPEHANHTVFVYAMGPGSVAAELHVAVEPELWPAQLGVGGVHHVALRAPTYDAYDAWAERLNALGIGNSGKIDRYWFRSLYFRKPNGVLLEIATDGPGFAVDEDDATLGEKVVLAPFLEPQREAIVANLKPID